MKGKDLKLLRISRDLTQAELGSLAGLHQQRISLIERGIEPTPAEKHALAKALDSSSKKRVQRGVA